MRNGLRLLAALFAAFVFTLSAWAQNVRVTGQVTAANTNSGVGSVSVRAKNGTAGALTDSTGRFALMVPSLPVTLVFTSIGYETQEVRVASTSSVLVSFVPSNIFGQEIVVSA